jgi:hypothetical protein
MPDSSDDAILLSEIATLNDIKELKGEHTGKISATEEEWNRRFEVIYKKKVGTEPSAVASNGIEQAAQDLLNYLDWTPSHTPCYPGREWVPIDDSTDSLDSGVMGLVEITWISNTALFAYDITGSQVGEEPVFIFDVKYKAMPYNITTGEAATLPWLQPCGIQWSSKSYEKVLEYGLNADNGYALEAIHNSAGDVFDPPIMGQVYHPVVTITRAELCSVNPNSIPVFIDTYMNAVNSDYVQIAGMWATAGYFKMTNLAAVRRDWHGYPYYECTYEIEINPDTWVTSPLDIGHNYWEGGYKKRFNTAQEHEDKPRCLDGHGGALPAAYTLTSAGYDFEYTVPPVYRHYLTLDQAAFASLGLPQNMNDSGIVIN